MAAICGIRNGGAGGAEALDEAVVAGRLASRHYSDTRTFFAAVRKLPAGPRALRRMDAVRERSGAAWSRWRRRRAVRPDHRLRVYRAMTTAMPSRTFTSMSGFQQRTRASAERLIADQHVPDEFVELLGDVLAAEGVPPAFVIPRHPRESGEQAGIHFGQRIPKIELNDRQIENA